MGALADPGRPRPRLQRGDARRRASSRRGRSATAVTPRRSAAARGSLLPPAIELEGHADNVAASLFGGVVATAAGHVVVVPLALEPAVVPWVPVVHDVHRAVPRRPAPQRCRSPTRCSTSGARRCSSPPWPPATSRRSRRRPRTGCTRTCAWSPRPRPGEALAAGLEAGAWCGWLSGSGPTVALLCAPEDAAGLAAALPTGGRADDPRRRPRRGDARLRRGSLEPFEMAGEDEGLVGEEAGERAAGRRWVRRRGGQGAGGRAGDAHVDEAGPVDDPRDVAAGDLEAAPVEQVGSSAASAGSRPRAPTGGRGPSPPPRSAAPRRGRSSGRSAARRPTPAGRHRVGGGGRCTASSYCRRSASPAHGQAATPSWAAAHGVASGGRLVAPTEAHRAPAQRERGLQRVDDQLRHRPRRQRAEVQAGGGRDRVTMARRGHAESTSRRT